MSSLLTRHANNLDKNFSLYKKLRQDNYRIIGKDANIVQISFKGLEHQELKSINDIVSKVVICQQMDGYVILYDQKAVVKVITQITRGLNLRV